MAIKQINSRYAPRFPIGQHIPSSTPFIFPVVHSSSEPHHLPRVLMRPNSLVKLPPKCSSDLPTPARDPADCAVGGSHKSAILNARNASTRVAPSRPGLAYWIWVPVERATCVQPRLTWHAPGHN